MTAIMLNAHKLTVKTYKMTCISELSQTASRTGDSGVNESVLRHRSECLSWLSFVNDQS